MIKLARRLLASTVAGLSIHPVTQAAPPTHEPIVEVDQDSEARLIAEHPMQAVGVRAEYCASYSGAKTLVTPELLEMIGKSKRFRNSCLVNQHAETAEFIRKRTK